MEDPAPPGLVDSFDKSAPQFNMEQLVDSNFCVVDSLILVDSCGTQENPPHALEILPIWWSSFPSALEILGDTWRIILGTQPWSQRAKIRMLGRKNMLVTKHVS